MELTERNIISIVQIIFFVPSLAIALFLCKRHGFGRNAGWLILVIFSLLRIVGGALQLASTAQPDNLGLFFGALIVQTIGLSGFIIVLLALINRVLESSEKSRNALINPRSLRLAQLAVLVGLILGAYGGSHAASQFADTGVYQVSTYTEAGVALTIVGFGIVVISTALLGLNISQVDPDEKRVVLAVALSLPFLFVRVLYSAIGTFNPNSAFSSVTGSVNVFIGTAVVQEFVIVIIIEGFGLTFSVRPKSDTESSSILGSVFKFLRGRGGNYRLQNLNQGDRRRNRRHNRPDYNQAERYEGYRQGIDQRSGQYEEYDPRLSQNARLHNGPTSV